MSRKRTSLLPAMTLIVLLILQSATGTLSAQNQGQQPRQNQLPPIPIVGDTTHTLTRHFIPASTKKKGLNDKGFIQRWLVLEPVQKNIARNSI